MGNKLDLRHMTRRIEHTKGCIELFRSQHAEGKYALALFSSVSTAFQRNYRFSLFVEFGAIRTFVWPRTHLYRRMLCKATRIKER